MRGESLFQVVAAVAAAALVATLARRVRALDRSGAVAAGAVGATIVVAGGWWWGVLLILFFVTSSAWSRVGRRRLGGGQPIEARGAERDAIQVLANGGLPAAFALASVGGQRALCYVAFAGALAAVAADTWATEVGRYSRTPPRLVTTWRRVARGTSGGVSLLGTSGAAGGACLIAVASGIGIVADWAPDVADWQLIIAWVAVAGFGGSLVDSLLGATVQAGYRCPRCDLPTERRVHACGTETVLVRGWSIVNNDLVNVAAALAGAMIAAALFALG